MLDQDRKVIPVSQESSGHIGNMKVGQLAETQGNPRKSKEQACPCGFNSHYVHQDFPGGWLRSSHPLKSRDDLVVFNHSDSHKNTGACYQGPLAMKYEEVGYLQLL